MRVLILSCNTGGGHNAAGRALHDRLLLEGHEAKLLDIMSLAGRYVSKVVGDTYINVAKYTPRLFYAVYKVADRIGSPRRKSPVYFANAAMAEYLADYLAQYQPDILAMPHLFPAETITYMKKRDLLKIPAVAIATDYTCIPFWEETDCDAYVIPHPDLSKEFIEKGLPKDRIFPLGIPCSMELYPKVPAWEAREQLLLNPAKPVFLIIGGSMGFGKIKPLTGKLFSFCGEGEQIAVICGNDRRMRESLEEEYSGEERIHIMGYTDQVPLWMDASDVIFTKPGGLTSTEALVKQIPMVHTAPIPGCETKNARFFSERGMSVTETSVEEEVMRGIELLRDEKMQRRMIEAQKRNANPQASLDIVHLMEKMVRENIW